MHLPIERVHTTLAHEDSVAMNDVNAEEECDGIVTIVHVSVYQLLQTTTASRDV